MPSHRHTVLGAHLPPSLQSVSFAQDVCGSFVHTMALGAMPDSGVHGTAAPNPWPTLR